MGHVQSNQPDNLGAISDSGDQAPHPRFHCATASRLPSSCQASATPISPPRASRLPQVFDTPFDFVTPIGHQCNTLVMEPGGYHFGDYRRLGASLSLLVILAGVPPIVLVWGLHK